MVLYDLVGNITLNRTANIKNKDTSITKDSGNLDNVYFLKAYWPNKKQVLLQIVCHVKFS